MFISKVLAKFSPKRLQKKDTVKLDPLVCRVQDLSMNLKAIPSPNCHGLLGWVLHTTVRRALNYIKDFTNRVQDTLRGRVDKDNPTEVKGEYNFPPTSHVNLNLSHERLYFFDGGDP